MASARSPPPVRPPRRVSLPLSSLPILPYARSFTMASYDNEKAIIDDASSDNADGTKKIQPAFTSVDENRCVAPWCDLADRDSDALSYDELPKSLIAKIDIRLIPALAFMCVHPSLCSLIGQVRNVADRPNRLARRASQRRRGGARPRRGPTLHDRALPNVNDADRRRSPASSSRVEHARTRANPPQVSYIIFGSSRLLELSSDTWQRFPPTVRLVRYCRG